jgi:hypothetical protein
VTFDQQLVTSVAEGDVYQRAEGGLAWRSDPL